MKKEGQSNFINYEEDENILLIYPDSMVLEDIGYHRINVTATEITFGETYIYKNSFYLHVYNPNDSDNNGDGDGGDFNGNGTNGNGTNPIDDKDKDKNGNGNNNLQKSSLIRGNGEVDAFVEGFDPTGSLTIDFLKKVIVPEDFKDLNRKKITV